MFTVGPLIGLTASTVVGFDIYNAPGTAATSPGIGYLANSNTLFTLDLSTGVTTSINTIGLGLTIVDIAVVPEPGSLALCGLASVAFAAYRQRSARKAWGVMRTGRRRRMCRQCSTASDRDYEGALKMRVLHRREVGDGGLRALARNEPGTVAGFLKQAPLTNSISG